MNFQKNTAVAAVTAVGLCEVGIALFLPEARPYLGLPDQPANIAPVNMNTLPSKLPKAVGEQIVNAVGVVLGPGNNKSPAMFVFASGVRVSGDEYLTAGHVAYSDNDQPKPQLKECNTFFVGSTSNSTNYHNGKSYPITAGEYRQGITLPDSKAVGSFAGNDDLGTIPDVTLMQVDDKKAIPAIDKQDTLPKLKPTVFSSTLKEGQDVYLINYQPTKNGESRNPVQERPSILSKPAIFGTTIVYRETNGDYVALEGMKSYGAIDQTYAVPGSSGGGAYTSTGQFIGESVYASVKPLSTQTYIEDGLALKDYSNFKKLSFVTIQYVSKNLVSSLRDRLAQSPKCK